VGYEIVHLYRKSSSAIQSAWTCAKLNAISRRSVENDPTAYLVGLAGKTKREALCEFEEEIESYSETLLEITTVIAAL
jgi:hypothetical protein